MASAAFAAAARRAAAVAAPTRSRALAPLGAVRSFGSAFRPHVAVEALEASAPSAAVASSQRRAAAATGVHVLQAPTYAQVPIVQEKPEAIQAEMPELILSGPRLGGRAAPEAGAAGQPGAGGPSALLGLPLTEAPTLDVEALTPATSATPGAPPEVRFGQLDNGVRIVVLDRKGLCSSLGLFVHIGSRYESAETACLPHMLELMAYRSSEHLSHMRTLKTLEQLGAGASCRVGREDLVYQFDVLREYVPVALPLMLGNVLCPSILPEEVAEAHQHVLEVQHNLEENAESLISELLHVTAYRGNTLGHGLYAQEKDLPLFTAENLRNYIRRECTPDRMIIVGVNADFDDVCKWAARSFAEHGGALQAKAPPRPLVPAVYTGGENRVERPNPLCHLMLGWEVAGGWNGPQLAAITVLQMFLGGGGSFSTGGPGKGMHTRLYTEVLNRHHWVESCQATSIMYADSGIFYIYATVVPQHAEDFIGVIARIFQGLNKISPDELRRAKNALKSSIHMNLEMRGVILEDVGRQLVLSGKVGTAQEFGKMVDAVTAQDLVKVLQACLRTELTMVAYGAIEKVPTLAKAKAKFVVH